MDIAGKEYWVKRLLAVVLGAGMISTASAASDAIYDIENYVRTDVSDKNLSGRWMMVRSGSDESTGLVAESRETVLIYDSPVKFNFRLDTCGTLENIDASYTVKRSKDGITVRTDNGLIKLDIISNTRLQGEFLATTPHEGEIDRKFPKSSTLALVKVQDLNFNVATLGNYADLHEMSEKLDIGTMELALPDKNGSTALPPMNAICVRESSFTDAASSSQGHGIYAIGLGVGQPLLTQTALGQVNLEGLIKNGSLDVQAHIVTSGLDPLFQRDLHYSQQNGELGGALTFTADLESVAASYVETTPANWFFNIQTDLP